MSKESVHLVRTPLFQTYPDVRMLMTKPFAARSSRWVNSQGCKDAAIYPGAAPITLIDGDKLLELLLKHGVGVKKKQMTLIEIDESTFEEANTTVTPPQARTSEELCRA